jgi:hypothetical protein
VNRQLRAGRFTPSRPPKGLPTRKRPGRPSPNGPPAVTPCHPPLHRRPFRGHERMLIAHVGAEAAARLRFSPAAAGRAPFGDRPVTGLTALSRRRRPVTALSRRRRPVTALSRRRQSRRAQTLLTSGGAGPFRQLALGSRAQSVDHLDAARRARAAGGPGPCWSGRVTQADSCLQVAVSTAPGPAR